VREKEKGARENNKNITLKNLLLHAAPMGLDLRYSETMVQ
jgi:hypothetical protein